MADCANPNQASEPIQQSQDSAGCRPRKRKPKDALELSSAGHLKRILEVDLTTNLAENAIRPIALGRKNWIHLGCEGAGPRI